MDHCRVRFVKLGSAYLNADSIRYAFDNGQAIEVYDTGNTLHTIAGPDRLVLLAVLDSLTVAPIVTLTAAE